MQVSVEESGSIERKLTISVPSDDIELEIAKRLKGVAREARIPGFRPGKAPQRVIAKRYTPQVTNDVVSEKINASYVDALDQKKIIPAGLVSIEPTPYEAGQDLQYVATIEVFPEIPSPTLEGKIIEKPVVEVAEEDIARTLDDIRMRNANFVSKADAAVKGDRLTIDFEGKIDGEAFNGGAATDFQFLLGEGQMLEEFDKALDGAKPGDEKKIAFSFPEDYGSEEVAGKDVEFEVSVKVVENPELPALDDKLAETLGIAEGGIEKMREEIKNNLQRELDSRLRTAIRDNVMNALHDSNEFDVPRALIEEEITRSVNMMASQLESQGLPTDNVDRSVFTEEARRRVVLGLIAREVVDKQEIKADQSMIRAQVEQMAQSYEDAEAYVDWYMSDAERLKNIEAMVMEDQIVEKMLETAKVEEKKLTFLEFMNPSAA